MWPDHCIQGTHGAEYHKDLIVKNTDIEILKGTQRNVDTLSGFGGPKESTGLFRALDSNKIEEVYIVGLAFDYSLGYTAEDSAWDGWLTYVVKDATRSVDPDDERFMDARLEAAGVRIIKTTGYKLL